jgi:rubrerythrin
MASESTDDGSLVVALPADLSEWLDDRATRLGVDREAVLVQLLASYRAAAELGDSGGSLPVADADVVSDAVEAELDDRVDPAVESALEDHLDGATEAVRRDLDGRIEAAETEFAEKIDDVRDRVVQVKREADTKAPRDHSHPELDRLDDIASRLGALADRLDTVEDHVEHTETTVADHGRAVERIDGTLEEVQDRLQTVAWAVTDLREAVESRDADAVEGIKRRAARADVSRAKCGNCGNAVEVALLTDPECPHCQATVSDVRPAAGFFSKPRLVVASRLESGEQQ